MPPRQGEARATRDASRRDARAILASWPSRRLAHSIVTPDTTPAATAVVLADADAASRVPLATALRQRRFEVIEAENGLEVLLYVKRRHPDAAIVALDLPRVDSLEALRRIRAFDPGIRVVVLGPPTPAALAEGAVAVLPKPVRVDDLVTVLNTPMQIGRAHV